MEHDDYRSPILGRRQILRRAATLGVLGLAGRASARSLVRLDAAASADSDLDFSELDPLDLGVEDLVDDPTLQAVCTMTPSSIVGPYYLNLNLVRSDITEGMPGLPTRVYLHVVRASDCTPIPNAAVDVWHCDALGRYSGFANQGTGGQTFLRGIQFTDESGLAMFDTVYPGWYPGRTTHMHLKVRPTAQTELSTQLYYKQRLTNRVYRTSPYITHGPSPENNLTDNFFLQETVFDLLSTGPRMQLDLAIGVA
ncbi:MAG: hypothetical protein ACKVWV_00075 [Planctomycetota bacterium]